MEIRIPEPETETITVTDVTVAFGPGLDTYDTVLFPDDSVEIPEGRITNGDIVIRKDGEVIRYNGARVKRLSTRTRQHTRKKKDAV